MIFLLFLCKCKHTMSSFIVLILLLCRLSGNSMIFAYYLISVCKNQWWYIMCIIKWKKINTKFNIIASSLATMSKLLCFSWFNFVACFFLRGVKIDDIIYDDLLIEYFFSVAISWLLEQRKAWLLQMLSHHRTLYFPACRMLQLRRRYYIHYEYWIIPLSATFLLRKILINGMFIYSLFSEIAEWIQKWVLTRHTLKWLELTWNHPRILLMEFKQKVDVI